MKDRQKDYCCVCGKKFEPIELRRHRMHTQWYWCPHHDITWYVDDHIPTTKIFMFDKKMRLGS